MAQVLRGTVPDEGVQEEVGKEEGAEAARANRKGGEDVMTWIPWMLVLLWLIALSAMVDLVMMYEDVVAENDDDGGRDVCHHCGWEEGR